MNKPSEKTMFGYHGRYLRIDVGRQTSEAIVLEESLLRKFLGGSGLGTHLLLAEEAATCEDWAPEAALVFVFSPARRQPANDISKICSREQEPADRKDQRLVGPAVILRSRARRPDLMRSCLWARPQSHRS